LSVVGANRLAAIGLLSFPAAPGERGLTAAGARRDENGWSFLWPIWSAPLSRGTIESILCHPAIATPALDALRPLGIVDLLRARRISNGKFMNVTRAQPVA